MFYLAEVVAVRERGERPASIVGDDNQSTTTNDVHLSTYVTLTTYVVARTVDGQAESQSQLRQQTLYDVQHEHTRTCYIPPLSTLAKKNCLERQLTKVVHGVTYRFAVVEDADTTERFAVNLQRHFRSQRLRKYPEYDVIGGGERSLGPVVVEPAYDATSGLVVYMSTRIEIRADPLHPGNFVRYIISRYSGHGHGRNEFRDPRNCLLLLILAERCSVVSHAEEVEASQSNFVVSCALQSFLINVILGP